MKDIDIIPIHNTFYTVIGIRIKPFESVIEDEQHFKDAEHAKEYAASLRKQGLYTIVSTV